MLILKNNVFLRVFCMIAVYSFTGKANGCNADTNAVNGFELFGQGTYGGSRGNNIINDQHVLVFQLVAFHKSEGMFHILCSAHTVFSRLTAIERRSLDGIIHDRESGSILDAQGNHLTLIESPLVFPCFSERYGEQCIYVVEKVGVLHSLSHESADIYAGVGLVVVFYLVNDVCRITVRLMIQ